MERNHNFYIVLKPHSRTSYHIGENLKKIHIQFLTQRGRTKYKITIL